MGGVEERVDCTRRSGSEIALRSGAAPNRRPNSWSDLVACVTDGRGGWSPRMVIFDCDGVLVDSDKISLQIQAAWLTSLGIPTSYEECVSRYLGRSLAAALADIEDRLGRPVSRMSIDRLDCEVNNAYRKHLRAIDGVVEALDALDALGLPYCIGSSARRSSIDLKLRLAGLDERFRGRIFSATDVKQGKPAPDVFMHAARAMGFQLQDCIVVHDNPFGVQAARAAGMRVLGYAVLTPPGRLRDADLLFHRMEELPWRVAQAFSGATMLGWGSSSSE